jgi:aminopeptidase N
MGDDAFRAGLRRYLTTRAFGAASSDDFWAALGGPPIVALARGWFERSGHPRLSIDSRCAAGALDVELRQDAHAPWKVPVVLTTPSTTLHVMLRHARTHLRLREPGGCAQVAIADDEELPFAVRYAGVHRVDPLTP